MGSSRIGPGTLCEWYRHSVTLSWTATWTGPLWANESSSAQKQRCTCDVLEECSPELMVSFKFGLQGISVGSRVWREQSDRQAPSIPWTSMPTHGCAHPGCWAIHIIWCITSTKNVFNIISPLWNIARQIIAGLGETQLWINVRRKFWRQVQNRLRANLNKILLSFCVYLEREG